MAKIVSTIKLLTLIYDNKTPVKIQVFRWPIAAFRDPGESRPEAHGHAANSYRRQKVQSNRWHRLNCHGQMLATTEAGSFVSGRCAHRYNHGQACGYMTLTPSERRRDIRINVSEPQVYERWPPYYLIFPGTSDIGDNPKRSSLRRNLGKSAAWRRLLPSPTAGPPLIKLKKPLDPVDSR
jgi:hypothetical protein